MNHSPDYSGGSPGLPPPHPASQMYLENGRYYGTFKKGKYMFPIDEAELDRLDIFHKFFLIVRRDACFSAPIHNRETPRILDLGCGTGIWGIDIAEQFPHGTIVGLDLNLIQPEYIPPNIQFQQRDIETPWQDMGLNSWDLVHMRMLNGSIANWPRLYSEIYRHLKPHYGFMEQVEIDFTPRADDGTLPRNSHLVQWADSLLDAMEGFDRSMRVDSELTRRRLAEAGFVDINEETIKFALNGWPTDPREKEMGRWFNLGITKGLHAYSLAPLHWGHSKSLPEINQLLDKVREEIRSVNIHAYFTMHIYTARRPQ